jgi:prevent-host-death family protein
MKTMGAAKFKAECLAIMDQVQLHNEPILITKKGKPAVVVSPAQNDPDPLAIYKFGGGSIVGDLVSPANDENDWECD